MTRMEGWEMVSKGGEEEHVNRKDDPCGFPSGWQSKPKVCKR